MIRLISAAFGLVALCAFPAYAACPAAPLGEPTVNGAQTIEVCHPGYLSLLDPVAKETRVVTYGITAQHSHGTLPRDGLQFVVDPGAPPQAQGRLVDYANSGYDLGHMAPNADFAWDAELQKQSFSMANVEPQLPGLNRQGWEALEEIARAEACARGAVVIFTGPVFPAHSTIGPDKIPVPRGFFKIIADPAHNWAIGFLVPHLNLAKADAPSKTVPIARIAQATGIGFPLPPNIGPGAQKPDAGVVQAYRAGKCG